MPHATDEAGSTARSMTSNTAFSPTNSTRLNNFGVNGSSSGDNKWRRASLPVSEAYSDLHGGRGRSGSIISTTSNATTTRRHMYHEHSHRGNATSRDRILRDSPLIAELRTNVIIKDEYSLVTDLSYHLAVRFSKPDSSIMINVDHSSCLALGGTFDPCYILTLTTLPSFLSADSNRRNAALIQSFMADILSVPPDRGIIRYNLLAEENYAINGNTVYGELERYETAVGAESVRRMGADPRKSGLHQKRSAADIEQHKTNGTMTDREQRAARRRSTLNENSPEVFELAADSDGRPSTGATNPVEGGSRSQPNSRENLKNETARNARPKTVAAQPNGSLSANDSFADARAQAKPKHISTVVKAEQKSAHMPASTKAPRPMNNSPNRTHSSGTKSLTSATPTPVTLKETIVDNPKLLKADSKYDSDSAAMTTKRRSTITATPRLPAPPPVPDSKTPKVSKRKSFLAAFRR